MDVTPLVAKEIVRRFRRAKENDTSVTLTPELSAFVLRLSLLSSTERDANGNVEATPAAIEAKVEELATYFCSCSPHVMATLSLQCQTLGLREKSRAKRKAELVKHEAITIQLVDSICDDASRLPEELLSEMTFFILHYYKQLGSNESDSTSRSETSAVLHAVLPLSQVHAFALQSSNDKKRQLGELRRIVWGIRLYNVASGRNINPALASLREKADASISTLHKQIQTELNAASSLCTMYTSLLLSPSASVDSTRRQELREEYYRELQLLLNLRMAHQQLESFASRMYTYIIPAFESALSDLKSALGTHPMRSDGVSLHRSVPKRVVYPMFIALADAYEDGLRSFEAYSEIRLLLALSLSMGKVPTPSFPPTLLKEVLNLVKDDTEEDTHSVAKFVQSATQSPTYNETHEQKALHYADTHLSLHSHSARSALNGMCPVTLMEDGLCVEGRINEKDPAFPGFIVRVGTNMESGRWYAFKSGSRLMRFVSSPLKFVQNAMQMAKENMVLAGLLGMLDELPHELYLEGTRKYEVADQSAASGNADVGTQTGQIDSYIDHNYRWNEWDLRRQALKLVNLLNMRTHSTQTIASHFRRDNVTQCRPPKDGSTQTMHDIAIQPPRTVQYLKGLRGTETSAIETVQRTFFY
ncbi:putative protein of unknown function (DUF3508) [Trypanosoma vivax]|nr:putative protein of unknown function (DUF3508) [Trypanosoma vivax]